MLLFLPRRLLPLKTRKHKKKRSSVHKEQGKPQAWVWEPALLLTQLHSCSPGPVISAFYDKNYQKFVQIGQANEPAGHARRFLVFFLSSKQALLNAFRNISDPWPNPLWDVRSYSRCVKNYPSSHTPSMCIGDAWQTLIQKCCTPLTEVHKEEHNCYSNPMFENINLTNPHALESIGHFSLKYKFFTISNWKSFYDLIKESACNEGDPGSIPGSGRSPGEGNGYPLQYPCLENPHGQRSLVGHSPWGCRELDTMDCLTLLWLKIRYCVYSTIMDPKILKGCWKPTCSRGPLLSIFIPAFPRSWLHYPQYLPQE